MSYTLDLLLRSLPPYIDKNDTVVNLLAQAIDSNLSDAYSNLMTTHEMLNVIGASGSALDLIASFLGLFRLPNELDNHLMLRMASVLIPGETMNGFKNVLELITTNTGDIWNPGGLSLNNWNLPPNWIPFRENISLTYTCNSPALDWYTGTVVPSGSPTFLSTNSVVPFTTDYQTGVGLWQGATQLIPHTEWTATTSGVPVDITFTTASGSTLSVTSETMPAVGNNIYWSSASGSTTSSLITTDAIAVTSGATYCWSLYSNENTSSPVDMQIIDGATTTTIQTPTSASGWVQWYGSYTTASTSIQLQLAMPSGITGDLYTGMWQLESGTYPTLYIPNQTAGSLSRDVMTLSLSNNNTYQGNQGVISFGVYLNDISQEQISYVFDSGTGISIYYDNGWNAVVGNVTVLQSTKLSSGWHTFVLYWDNYLTGFMIDGVLVTGSSPTIPTTSGTGYIGSNYLGANQINGYITNLVFSSARYPDSELTKWLYNTITPVFSPNLFQAFFVNNNLTGFQSGVYDYQGYWRSNIPSSPFVSSTSNNTFFIDNSFLDNSFLIQATNPSAVFNINNFITYEMIKKSPAGFYMLPFTRGEIL